MNQHEYDMIKASWQRNGQKRELAALAHFEALESDYRRLSLDDRIEQVRNIVKHNIKIR